MEASTLNKDWQEYKGIDGKGYFDIKLHTGREIHNCWKVLSVFVQFSKETKDNVLFDQRDVAYIRHRSSDI